MNKCLLVLMLLIVVATAQLMRPKRGVCPPPIASQFCSSMCFGDHQCPGMEKCCRTSCDGALCVMPVSERRPVKDKSNLRCPSKKSGPWVCSSTCSVDSDCRGRNKCCPGRCPNSMVCQKPEM